MCTVRIMHQFEAIRALYVRDECLPNSILAFKFIANQIDQCNEVWFIADIWLAGSMPICKSVSRGSLVLNTFNSVCLVTSTYEVCSISINRNVEANSHKFYL